MKPRTFVVFVLFVVSFASLCLAQSHGPKVLSDLPPAAQSQISSAIGNKDSKYQIQRRGSKLIAQNQAQGLQATFTRDGIDIEHDGLRWRMALIKFGYVDSLRTASHISPRSHGSRVEYARGEIVEWYKNSPLGLEQGFEIPQRLAESPTSPLELVLAMSGDLTAQSGDAALNLKSKDGTTLLRYAGLTAYDASGRELNIHLNVNGKSTFQLEVDDSEAQYPIVIDPIVQVARLAPSDPQNLDAFGWSVAVSGDTILVGCPQLNFNVGLLGAAYLFVKPKQGWIGMTETAKLTPSDGIGQEWFGLSVSISGDTAIVGNPDGETVGPGGVYVYVKPSSGWVDMTETAKLTASDGANSDQLGYSASISGNVIVGGAYFATIGSNAGQGAAYVFVRPKTGWVGMTETAKLTASDGASFDYFGNAVSINCDTILVASPNAEVGVNHMQGAGYVFVKPSGGWQNMTQNAKLTASDGAPNDSLGRSATVDGDTALLGAPLASINGHQYQGAAYLFQKPVTGWINATETAKLWAASGYTFNFFGASVALNGEFAIMGAPNIKGISQRQGAAFLFVKPSTGWKTTGSYSAAITVNEKSHGQFGTSVALMGNTIVAGTPYQNALGADEVGLAYVFAP